MQTPPFSGCQNPGTTRSVSRNDDDCDDNECRNQRKNAIKRFRSRPCGSAGRGHRLSRRLWFVREPADSSGFHWIQRDDDFLDVTAFGAVERAKLESRRPRRDARKHHSRSAFRAAESLNSEQWDCGWVIGHGIPPLDRAGPPNSQSPGGDDGRNMISGVQSRWSILLTFRKLIVWQTGRPRLFRLKAAWSLVRRYGLRIMACARRGEPAIDGICLKCRADACCPLLDRAACWRLQQRSPQDHGSDGEIDHQSRDVDQGRDEWCRSAGRVEPDPLQDEREH